jgi:hypothetical protein
MTNLHGKVCTYADVRGPRTSIVINSISSTHTDLIDITHDDNFYQALSSNAIISSLDTGMSLTGNVCARKALGIDFMTLSHSQNDNYQDHTAWHPKMLGPIPDPKIPDQ